MIRRTLRSVLRTVGYDGMEISRFDRLKGAQLAAETQERLRPVFHAWALRGDPTYFVQIGANDGEKHDAFSALRNAPSVRSALVEPNPACVRKLEKIRNANPHVTLLPSALAAEDGFAALYRFSARTEKNLQLDLVTSFSRKHLEDFRRYYGLQAEIISETTATSTLATLLRQAAFPRLDILASDIEGFDHLAVEQALTLAQPPRLIIFEHYWLTAELRERCYQLLAKRGYGIVHGATDAFCVLTAPAAGPD
ncbi:MAG: FkbM family methyltransferase [Verrucomicrobiota bacterium]